MCLVHTSLMCEVATVVLMNHHSHPSNFSLSHSPVLTSALSNLAVISSIPRLPRFPFHGHATRLSPSAPSSPLSVHLLSAAALSKSEEGSVRHGAGQRRLGADGPPHEAPWQEEETAGIQRRPKDGSDPGSAALGATHLPEERSVDSLF